MVRMGVRVEDPLDLVARGFGVAQDGIDMLRVSRRTLWAEAQNHVDHHRLGGRRISHQILDAAGIVIVKAGHFRGTGAGRGAGA